MMEPIDSYKNLLVNVVKGAKFDNVEVVYFGSLTWLFPILRKFLNDDLMKEISSSFDKKINIKKFAFKFINKAIK